MWKTSVAAVLIATAVAANAAEQDAKRVIDEASKAMGVIGLSSITFSGSAATGNFGQSRTITQLSGGTISLLKAWLEPVAVGDGFQLLPGCDHTLATCQNSFNNLSHFGGFPYIPPPELAV